MCVTPRRIFAASWVAGGLLFALTFIDILSSASYGYPLGLIASTGVLTMIIAADLLGLWTLVEIGGLAGVVNFQPKFKRPSGTIAVAAIGLVTSFLFMVVLSIATFLMASYFFR